jgi:hypothetical protein
MLMAPLCFQNGGNSPHNKHLVISLIFILKFSKKLDKSYNNLKDCFFFSNKFDVGIFYGF